MNIMELKLLFVISKLNSISLSLAVLSSGVKDPIAILYVVSKFTVIYSSPVYYCSFLKLGKMK